MSDQVAHLCPLCGAYWACECGVRPEGLAPEISPAIGVMPGANGGAELTEQQFEAIRPALVEQGYTIVDESDRLALSPEDIALLRERAAKVDALYRMPHPDDAHGQELARMQEAQLWPTQPPEDLA